MKFERADAEMLNVRACGGDGADSGGCGAPETGDDAAEGSVDPAEALAPSAGGDWELPWRKLRATISPTILWPLKAGVPDETSKVPAPNMG